MRKVMGAVALMAVIILGGMSLVSASSLVATEAIPADNTCNEICDYKIQAMIVSPLVAEDLISITFPPRYVLNATRTSLAGAYGIKVSPPIVSPASQKVTFVVLKAAPSETCGVVVLNGIQNPSKPDLYDISIETGNSTVLKDSGNATVEITKPGAVSTMLGSSTVPNVLKIVDSLIYNLGSRVGSDLGVLAGELIGKLKTVISVLP